MSSHGLFRNSIKEKRSWVKNVVGKTFILTFLIVIYQGFSSFRNRSRPIEDFIDDSFRVNLFFFSNLLLKKDLRAQFFTEYREVFTEIKWVFALIRRTCPFRGVDCCFSMPHEAHPQPSSFKLIYMTH